MVAALRSDHLTQGPAVEAFERALAERCEVPHAVAVANGTAALHLACLALDLPAGSVGITSALTFAASANAMELSGLVADFSDVDPVSSCMDALTLEAALARLPEGRARLVVPVHFAGHPCPMDEIAAVASARGLRVIEDACHALGADHPDGRGGRLPVGSCAHADLAVLSFHPVKHVTSGEGGAVLTRDAALAERLRALRSHGMEGRPERLKVPEEAFDPATGEKNAWYHEMHSLGLNYRLTDLQAALGASQLRKLPRFLQKRRALAARYAERLAPLPFARLPTTREGYGHAWHLYVVGLDFDALGLTRHQVMVHLRERGIGTQVHYLPVPFHPYYRDRCAGRAWPEAEAAYRRCLSLPLHPGMDASDVDAVADALEELGR